MDLRNASPRAIKAQYGVAMERACEVLRGVPQLELDGDRATEAADQEFAELCKARGLHRSTTGDHGYLCGPCSCEAAATGLRERSSPCVRLDQSLQGKRAEMERQVDSAFAESELRYSGAYPGCAERAQGYTPDWVSIQQGWEHAEARIGQGYAARGVVQRIASRAAT